MYIFVVEILIKNEIKSRSSQVIFYYCIFYFCNLINFCYVINKLTAMTMSPNGKV